MCVVGEGGLGGEGYYELEEDNIYMHNAQLDLHSGWYPAWESSIHSPVNAVNAVFCSTSSPFSTRPGMLNVWFPI